MTQDLEATREEGLARVAGGRFVIPLPPASGDSDQPCKPYLPTSENQQGHQWASGGSEEGDTRVPAPVLNTRPGCGREQGRQQCLLPLHAWEVLSVLSP